MNGTRPPDAPITSLDNPQVRLIRALREPAGRRRQRAFLVEGLRLVETAAAVTTPRVALYVPPFGQHDSRERRLLRTLLSVGCPLLPVSGAVLAQVADTVTPQGIVAVVPLPDEVDEVDGPSPASAGPATAGPATAGPAELETPLALVLDAVGDPGNAGTLLRSATGAGATAVLATKGTVDLYAPKVVRAGAGAHFLLNLRAGQDWADLPARLPRDCQVLLADPAAPLPYWEVDWTRPSAIVVSNEAHGASAGARALATGAVGIPARGIESLNVAVAGSIILFEAARQRQSGPALPDGERASGVPGARRVRRVRRVRGRRGEPSGPGRPGGWGGPQRRQVEDDVEHTERKR